MRKRQHGTICYRPSASVMNSVLTVVAVAVALLAGGPHGLWGAALGGWVGPRRARVTARADAKARDTRARPGLRAAVPNGDGAGVGGWLGAGADAPAADAGGGVVMPYAAAAGSTAA